MLQNFSLIDPWQNCRRVLVFALLGVCVGTIHLQKTVKQNHLAACNVLLATVGNANRNVGFFGLCISHLRSQSAFANKVIQPLSLGICLYGLTRELSGTDSLVSLLRSLYLVCILSCFEILFTILRNDKFLCLLQGKIGQIDRICSHIGDISRLIELLGNQHGSRYRHSEPF